MNSISPHVFLEQFYFLYFFHLFIYTDSKHICMSIVHSSLLSYPTLRGGLTVVRALLVTWKTFGYKLSNGLQLLLSVLCISHTNESVSEAICCGFQCLQTVEKQIFFYRVFLAHM